MELILLRHGKTAANLEHRYNGVTDDPLCEEGLSEARSTRAYPDIPLVYVSPLKRARQTADICFPNAEKTIVDSLREMNFGDFEGRTAQEMEHDSDYRAWVDGGCVEACPNGESIPSFAKRAMAAFDWVVRDARVRGLHRAGVTAHGGIIMAIMYGYSHTDVSYFDWYVENCSGFRLVIDETAWPKKPGFVSYELLGNHVESQSMTGREIQD
jgi:alpha-ribazole phosphatase